MHFQNNSLAKISLQTVILEALLSMWQYCHYISVGKETEQFFNLAAVPGFT